MEGIDRRVFLAGLAGAALAGCAPALALPTGRAAKLIAAARGQIGVTTRYDPGYSRLDFPNGDVPRDKGVCTDVVIRAYRDALGLDLQSLVNADMKRAFAAYPRNWGLRAADRNIDHRRVPNLQSYFKREAANVAVPARDADWQPGDIFTCMVGGKLPHIGIVSDRRTMGGAPFVIHNIGAGTREEDALSDHRITGRYRFRLDG